MNNQLQFWDRYPELKKQLIKVNKVIMSEIKHARGEVGKALLDAFSTEGKLLRPAMVLLFAEYDKRDKKQLKKLVNVAASVELLHNATLIHDDIIDNSDTRRGNPSIQAKYGKKVAVYAGDYLFALCFRLLSENSRGMRSLQFDSHIMQGILGGELGQLDRSYNTKITPEQYLEQINGKTGLLFGLSCFLGLYEGGGTLRQAHRASKFGEILGQAFQIKDDILDYTTTKEDLHKPVLLDVKNGIYSGPMIFALKNDSTNELESLIKKGEDLTNEELIDIEKLVNQLDGVKNAEKLATELTQKSISIITKKFSHLSTQQEILELSNYIINRTY